MDTHPAPDGSVFMLYGREGIRIRMPAGAEPALIGKRPLPTYPDPKAAVEHALSHPVGSAPFEVLARGKKSACILICDITRPVPNHLFLRPLIERLRSAGIALADIVVLVATGLHRPNEGEELAEVVGDPWVMANVRVRTTSRGTAPPTSTWASRRSGERRSSSTAGSWRRTSASRRAWSSRTSWPATRAGAR